RVRTSESCRSRADRIADGRLVLGPLGLGSGAHVRSRTDARARRSRTPRRRFLRIAGWVVGTLIVVGGLELAGIDVVGWFEQLWDTVTEISIGYVILGCLLQGAQTTLTALGWCGILRYAYPGGVTYMEVLAA
ncbi:MAG: hypothetical protein ABI783_03515, partial [Actinomycetota bacterium]